MRHWSHEWVNCGCYRFGKCWSSKYVYKCINRDERLLKFIKTYPVLKSKQIQIQIEKRLESDIYFSCLKQFTNSVRVTFGCGRVMACPNIHLYIYVYSTHYTLSFVLSQASPDDENK